MILVDTAFGIHWPSSSCLLKTRIVSDELKTMIKQAHRASCEICEHVTWDTFGWHWINCTLPCINMFLKLHDSNCALIYWTVSLWQFLRNRILLRNINVDDFWPHVYHSSFVSVGVLSPQPCERQGYGIVPLSPIGFANKDFVIFTA